MQGVDDAAAASLADHESEMPEDAELLRDGGAFHRDGSGEFADCAWTLAEAAEDADAARGRERLHGLGDLAGGRGVELAAV